MFVHPHFVAVEKAFQKFLSLPGEIGAALAVYHRGKLVVNVWGGTTARIGEESSAPWEENTLANVYSASKGVTNMCLLLLAQRGLLQYNDPVCKHWPEFAANGKEHVTVAQLMSHQAGLAFLDDKITLEEIAEAEAQRPSSPAYKAFAARLANQRPVWNIQEGNRCGYHALTIGFFASQLVHRVDPKHRFVRQFFDEEIGMKSKFQCDFHFGISKDTEQQQHRIARLYGLQPDPVAGQTEEFLTNATNPTTLTARTFSSVRQFTPWRARYLEIPAAVGFSSAKALGQLYSALSGDGYFPGEEKQLLFDVNHRKEALRCAIHTKDVVLCEPMMYSQAGFILDANRSSSFGHTGMGGSIGIGDTGFGGLGIGFVTNALHTNGNYSRRDEIVDTIYKCVQTSKL